MKKKARMIVAAICVALAATGCGTKTDTDKKAAEEDMVVDKSDQDETNLKENNSVTEFENDFIIKAEIEQGAGGKADIHDEGGKYYMVSSMNAKIGSAVEIEGEVEKGSILKFTYNPDKLNGVSPKALKMFKLVEENGTYLEIDNCVSDADNNTISGEISEGGVYFIVDAYMWSMIWGEADGSIENAHDCIYSDEEFQVTIPKEVTFNILSDYYKESYGLLSKDIIVSRDDNNTDILMRLIAYKFYEEGDGADINEPVEAMPLDAYIEYFIKEYSQYENQYRCVETFDIGNGKKGYLLEGQYDKAKFYMGFFEWDDNNFYCLSYTVYDETMKDAVVASIKSFIKKV